MEPTGTIVFSTVGRPNYGFDIFSVKFGSDALHQRRLTDGVSVNFNAQYVGDDEDESIVFISERYGSPQIFLARPEMRKAQLLPQSPSLFHDRPVVRGQRLYFVSAHEEPDKPFKSWTAVYSTPLHENKVLRLTPPGTADFSPAVSRSGKFVAVASYGSRLWEGDFRVLLTDIVVFPESDPNARVTLCQNGGWPTWSGDSTVYFHRQCEDGWWSIFKVEHPAGEEPVRITPPGVHCLTPAAMHNARKIAVATRRGDSEHRHIEIYDEESKEFHPVSALLSPGFHCYNPFVSPGSSFVGYHRFRGDSAPHGELTIPHLERVSSPFQGLKMLRINGSFPSFSPARDFIAANDHDFVSKPGLDILRSDGSKRWTLFQGRVAFGVSWSPTERNVIYTSIGPIFSSAKSTVQIARVSFDPAGLTDDREDIPVEIKILTDEGTGNNAFPCCSPDGKSIVFRSGRSGNKNLFVIDAVHGEFESDGGSIRQLTDGAWIDTMPSWSPDGKLIAFSSTMDNPSDSSCFNIYVVGPDGSGLRRICLPTQGRLNHVCWSADGEWLLFTANLAGVTAEPVSLPNQFQPYGDLFVVRIDGSELRRLTCNGYENGTPTWQPGDTDVEFDMDGDRGVGDKLAGNFEEPLWLSSESCDM